MANTLAHAAFMLAGLVLTLGAARALLQMAGGPVVESELIHASGTLTMVSPCSTGRNAHFSYRVNAQPAPVEASKPCPSPLQRQMAQYLGQTALLKYRDEHSISLVPRTTVYEFRVGDTALWTAQQTSAHERSFMWLTVPLTLMAAGAGMVLVWLGLKALLKLRRTTA